MKHRPQPITVVGSINNDLFTYAAKLPLAGETVVGKLCRQVPGGKGANQAVAIAKLGGTVALIGCLGTDSFSVSLRKNLEKYKVATQYIRTLSHVGCGSANIWVDDDGNNRIIVVPAANAYVTKDDVDHALGQIGRSRFLLAQLECPSATVLHAFARAKTLHAKPRAQPSTQNSPNVTTVLNAAPATALTAATLKPLFSRTDVLIVNEIELQQILLLCLLEQPAQKQLTTTLATLLATLTAAKQPAERTEPKMLRTLQNIIVQHLFALGIEEVIVTLGAAGVLYFHCQGALHYQAAPVVTTVDTTAAGDTFIGAYLQLRTTDTPTLQALHFATCAATLTVTQKGAQEAIPTYEKVNLFIKNINLTTHNN